MAVVGKVVRSALSDDPLGSGREGGGGGGEEQVKYVLPRATKRGTGKVI